MNKLENEKTVLQNEKNQLELNNQQLQNNSNDLKTQNKTLAEQKKQLDDQILAMENEKKRIEQDKWELEQEKKMLEFQKNKQQKDIEQLQKEIADLNNKKIEANKYSNKTAEEIEFNLPLKVGATTNVKNIFFAANSFVMKPTSDPQMEKIVSFLKQNNTIKIEIGGHTNGLCDEDYCKMLSEKRAKSVVDYLIMRGISANRLTYAGYGKTKPIVVDVNNMPTASELNQRVEVKITSLE
ncbi:MAG: OmpA family protein [Bacteroidetes bacterium]|nr:OmpA family protein [Bacteroidota bacterium]